METEPIIERTVKIESLGGGYIVSFVEWTRREVTLYRSSGKEKLADSMLVTSSLEEAEQAVHEFLSKES